MKKTRSDEANKFEERFAELKRKIKHEFDNVERNGRSYRC